MDLKTIKACCKEFGPARSVLLRGESGIGKSAFVKALAKEMGLEFIDIRLGQMTEGDLIGLPQLTEDGTKNVPPDYLVRASRKPCLVFFDELNRGMPSVIQGVFQIILDRKLGDLELHPESRVFAAINSGRKYDVTSLDPALLRRFAQFKFEPTPEEWIAAAPSFGVPNEVVQFLAANVGHLETMEPLPDDRIGPSRRSWTHVGEDLKASLARKDYSLVFPICYSQVGEEAAKAFEKYLHTAKRELTHLDVLAGKYSLEGQLHEDLIRVADSMAKHMCSEKYTKTQLKRFAEFVDKLPDELIVSTWRLIGNCAVKRQELGQAMAESLKRVL